MNDMGRRAPRKAKKKNWSLGLILITLGLTAFTINLSYQLFNKPTELLRVMGIWKSRTVTDTWAAYGSDFERYSTPVISPQFLAALAQAESSGNPVAAPPWRWQWTSNVARIYAPASTSVGLFQMTDGTYRRASQLCVVDKKVMVRKPWYEFGPCWTRWIYSRLIPSHSIEMTSAYLTWTTYRLLKRARATGVNKARMQTVAAITHLCGERVADEYIRNGFRISGSRTCGSHSLAKYVTRVKAYYNAFSSAAQRTTL